MNASIRALKRDAFGRLVLTDAEGREHVDVVPVRAFPLAAPDEGLSVLDAEGHELAWLARLSDLPEAQRALVAEALAQREFMPVIERLKSVSSYATPSNWDVETDRGPTRFMLMGEEHIHRMAPGMLLINDAHGVQYLIRDLDRMDRASRKLLDHFL
jgi:hypothetical protein